MVDGQTVATVLTFHRAAFLQLRRRLSSADPDFFVVNINCLSVRLFRSVHRHLLCVAVAVFTVFDNWFGCLLRASTVRWRLQLPVGMVDCRLCVCLSSVLAGFCFAAAVSSSPSTVAAAGRAWSLWSIVRRWLYDGRCHLLSLQLAVVG